MKTGGQHSVKTEDRRAAQCEDRRQEGSTV